MQCLVARELPLEDIANDILRVAGDMPEDENLILQAYQVEEPSDEEVSESPNTVRVTAPRFMFGTVFQESFETMC